MHLGSSVMRRIVVAIATSVGGIMLAKVAVGDDEIFTRSLYLPVNFQLCANLEQGRMYEDDRFIGPLPFRRVFLFTYYSDKARVLPEHNVLELTARNIATGNMVRGKFLVSQEDIRMEDVIVYRVSGKERKQIEAQFSRKQDARLKEVSLTIHCREESRYCQHECLEESTEQSRQQDSDG